MSQTTNQQPVMADFVFGGIEANESRLQADERARWSGLRHEYAICPLDPAPGDAVTLTVTVGADVIVDRLSAYVTNDGSDPKGRRGIAHGGFAVEFAPAEIRWEPLTWSYVHVWQATIPGQPTATMVRYVIEGWSSHDPDLSHWSREQYIDHAIEERTVYGYHVDSFTAPQWARSATVYQVFVDRFRNPAASDQEHSDLAPEALADFWGGNLQGVIEKLDFIADLGATVLWISPIFSTHSYHGYDTIDYYQVDARFGANDDLRRLVQEAHRRGVRVVLDLVVNHASDRFAPFQDALADPASPARSWFSFGAQYRHGYRTFFDVASMPQFNFDDAAARRAMCDVARHWLQEYDVDGYRLDYAAGPSHAFWSEFRAACRSAKPSCWLFGEVTRTGSQLRTYIGRLDGCLDFGFCRAVRQLCASTQPTIALSQFANLVERSRAFFGEDFGLPAFIDNHDMNRFLFVAGDSKQQLKLAAGLLFALAGTPVIYYGTEVGLSQPRPKGPHREEARHPMRWGASQDLELLGFFKRWIALRNNHPALIQGDYRTLILDDARGIWLLERQSHADRVLVAINVSEHTAEIALPDGDYVNLEGKGVRGMIELAAHAVDLLV